MYFILDMAFYEWFYEEFNIKILHEEYNVLYFEVRIEKL